MIDGILLIIEICYPRSVEEIPLEKRDELSQLSLAKSMIRLHKPGDKR
jgi:hypothetical protein